MLYQHRRDFRAIFICDHCDHTKTLDGYDDANFHQNVIPKMICKKCGKKAKDSYIPRATKYPEELTV